jgi:hypothetical protein
MDKAILHYIRERDMERISTQRQNAFRFRRDHHTLCRSTARPRLARRYSSFQITSPEPGSSGDSFHTNNFGLDSPVSLAHPGRKERIHKKSGRRCLVAEPEKYGRAGMAIPKAPRIVKML